MTEHIKIKQLISAEFDGEATADERILIAEHLKDCAECRQYMQEVRSLSVNLKQWEDESISADLQQKIKNDLKEVGKMKEKPLTYNSFMKSTVGSGVLVAILLAMFVVSTQTYIKRGVQGRLKGAADDIGDHFSDGNTNVVKIMSVQRTSGENFKPKIMKPMHEFSRKARVRDAAQFLEKNTGDLGNTVQYEPYYLKTSYDVVRDGSKPRGQITPTNVDSTKIAKVKEKTYGSSRKREAGGYEQSSYSMEDLAGFPGGSMPVSSLAVGAKQKKVVRKDNEQIALNKKFSNDTFARGVTKSVLLNDEVTTELLSSEVMNLEFEYWGAGSSAASLGNWGNQIANVRAASKAAQYPYDEPYYEEEAQEFHRGYDDYDRREVDELIYQPRGMKQPVKYSVEEYTPIYGKSIP